MKKLYTFILVCMFSSSLCAQGYFPMLDSTSNTWTFVANMVPVRMQQQAAVCDYNYSPFTSEIYTVNDSVIGSETYKVLYLKDANSGLPDCIYGYIREDTALKKIYFVDNFLSSPVLLYDFSLQVGDSISINFVSQLGSYFQDGTYFVDSISSITITAGPRRIYYLSIPGFPTPYPLEWIEGLGHPGHLIYSNSLNFSAGMMFQCNDPVARDFYHLLTCFEQNATKVYFDSCAHAFAINNGCFNYVDSCNFWNICSALDENTVLTDFYVSPNPSSGSITLHMESKRNLDARLEVLDLSGKLVLEKQLSIRQGVNDFVLETHLPEAGSYLVLLKFESGTAYRKLVRTSR